MTDQMKSLSLNRQSLFRSENPHIRAQIGQSKHVRDIMTPFALDGLINTEDQDNTKKRSERGPAKDKKKRLEFIESDDEKEEDDLGDQLFDQEFENMQADEKQAVMLGMDPEDPDDDYSKISQERI
jgi:hypothetical protein